MDVLKKIKASSLTEVLVATVIILLIFGIATTTLNNVLQGTVNKNLHLPKTTLTKLEYQYKNGLIKLPFYDEFENWEIQIQKSNDDIVIFEAENPKTKKKVIKKLLALEIE